jgi:hypothetical protein
VRGTFLPLACEVTRDVAGNEAGSISGGGVHMARKDSTGTSKAFQARSGRASSAASPALRPSSWAPRRGQLVPVALPKRFVDGVAWDEV